MIFLIKLGLEDKERCKMDGYNTNNSNNGSNKSGKRLFRSDTNKVFAGVCGGLGEYFNIDPTIIRVIAVIAMFGFGTGFLAYIILWLVMPQRRYQ